MDGSFFDLNGESMEVEVDEFLQEIYKSQKFFQQKQKKAGHETVAAVKRQPEREDEDKQESPTVAISCRVIEQIKEFKVHQK